MSKQDLSPFDKNPRHLAIGWLDAEHPYTQGKTSDDFRERLYELCLHPFIVFNRGLMKCPFCQKEGKPEPTVWNGQKMPYGASRIHIHGQGKKYIAHGLLFHYVNDHNYRPPDEFVEAVMRPRNWFQKKIDRVIFDCQ